MKRYNAAAVCTVSVLVGLIATEGLAQPIVVQRLPNGGAPEVLTRGPVHEAFAETITYDAQPGFNVPRPPPDPIDELPPDQRPDGDNVDWIPGYWAWDDERSDFLWISGVWRALPPDREWVPGYWGSTPNGYQWVSGYWDDTQRTEVAYLPEPPASIEIGPNISAPSSDYIWVPGTWVWYQGRYAWRPGYWMIAHSDWDWVPSHYVWAPRGYVYVDGYWDYSIARRGVLFAPVYFQRNVYTRTGFSYAPSTVISLSVFSDHLFVRPRYNHYYFGDYYAPRYRESGFHASFSFHSGRQGYDPIYANQRWRNRQNPDWDRSIQANFSYRRDHEDARPRHTLAAQKRYGNDDSRRGDRSYRLASSLTQYSRDTDNYRDRDESRDRGDSRGRQNYRDKDDSRDKDNHRDRDDSRDRDNYRDRVDSSDRVDSRDRDSRVQLRPLDSAERQRVVQRGKEIQNFRQERQRAEVDTRRGSTERSAKESEPTRIKARRSPIAAKSAAQMGKKNPPPRRPDHPQPDPKVERKSRKTVEKRDRKD